jgi:hypothetical protein
MLNRTRKCMQDLSQFIRPTNGKRLEVLVLIPTEVRESLPENARPQAIEISVTPENKDYRGDAKKFGSNFSCHIIGHELFHHLGLVDEYREEAEDDRSGNWSCRPVTTGTSYMRNTIDSFADVVPQSFNCSCDDNCKSMMQESPSIQAAYLSQRGINYFTNEIYLKKVCKFVEGSSSVFFLDEGEMPNNLTFKSDDGSIFTFEGLDPKGLLAEMVSAHELRYRPYAQRNTIRCDCSDDPIGNCTRAVRDVIRRSSVNNNRVGCPDANEQPVDLKISITGDETRVVGDRIFVQTRVNGDSLLSSGQVDQIISGNCLGGSPQYQRCAAFANISATSPACLVPPECRDSGYYLENLPVSAQ